MIFLFKINAETREIELPPKISDGKIEVLTIDKCIIVGALHPRIIPTLGKREIKVCP